MYAAAGMAMCLRVWVLVGGDTSTWMGSSVSMALSKFIMLVRKVTSPGMIRLGSDAVVAVISASIRLPIYASTESCSGRLRLFSSFRRVK